MCLRSQGLLLIVGFLIIHLLHVVHELFLEGLLLCHALRNIPRSSILLLSSEPAHILIVDILLVICFALAQSLTRYHELWRARGATCLIELGRRH